MDVNDIIFYAILGAFSIAFTYVGYALLKGYFDLFNIWKNDQINPLSVIFTSKYKNNYRVKEFKNRHNKRFLKVLWLLIPILALIILLVLINFK